MKSDFILTKKRIIPVVVILIIIAYFSVVYMNKVDLDNMFDEALRLQNLQRWQEAAELYKQISIKYYGSTRALEADFSSAEIYYYNLGARRLAEIELEKLMKDEKARQVMSEGCRMVAIPGADAEIAGTLLTMADA